MVPGQAPCVVTLVTSLSASLKSLLNCTEALCLPEHTVNTGTGNLSWSCCGEAPGAGFAAGMGLVLARAVCQGLSPTAGRVTHAAVWGDSFKVHAGKSDSVWVHKAPAGSLHTYSCISAFEDLPAVGG